MKRMITVFILLTVIIGICTASIVYVRYGVNEIGNSLSESITLVKKDKIEQAIKQIKKTQSLWQKHRNLFMVYVEQDLLDQLDDHLILLDALLLYHPEEFLPQATLCLSHLEEMKQRERISMYSWF